MAESKSRIFALQNVSIATDETFRANVELCVYALDYSLADLDIGVALSSCGFVIQDNTALGINYIVRGIGEEPLAPADFRVNQR